MYVSVTEWTLVCHWLCLAVGKNTSLWICDHWSQTGIVDLQDDQTFWGRRRPCQWLLLNYRTHFPLTLCCASRVNSESQDIICLSDNFFACSIFVVFLLIGFYFSVFELTKPHMYISSGKNKNKKTKTKTKQNNWYYWKGSGNVGSYGHTDNLYQTDSDTSWMFQYIVLHRFSPHFTPTDVECHAGSKGTETSKCPNCGWIAFIPIFLFLLLCLVAWRHQQKIRVWILR